MKNLSIIFKSLKKMIKKVKLLKSGLTLSTLVLIKTGLLSVETLLEHDSKMRNILSFK